MMVRGFQFTQWQEQCAPDRAVRCNRMAQPCYPFTGEQQLAGTSGGAGHCLILWPPALSSSAKASLHPPPRRRVSSRQDAERGGTPVRCGVENRSGLRMELSRWQAAGGSCCGAAGWSASAYPREFKV